MSQFLSLFSTEHALQLTITLAHFLWQGCVVVSVASLLTSLCRNRSAALRYNIHVLALFMLVACVVATYSLLGAAGPVSVAGERSSAMGESASDAERPASERAARGTSALPTEQPRLQSAVASPPWLSALAPVVVVAYLVGAGILLCRLCLCGWRVHRLRRSTDAFDNPAILDIVAVQAQRLDLRLVPAIQFCRSIAVPSVVGIVRPVILMPVTILSGLNHEQLSAIVCHELAHIRRHDLLLNMLQRLIECLLFFHPAVWYLSRQISAEREACCDDMVISAGRCPLDYADAMLRMAELCQAGTPNRISMAATGPAASQFETRIRRLIYGNPNANRLDIRVVFLCLGLLCAAVVTPILVASRFPQPVEPEVAAGEDKKRREAKKDAPASTTRTLDRLVTLNAGKMPIKEVFAKLAEAAELKLNLDKSLKSLGFPISKSVSLNFNKVPLQTAIKKTLGTVGHPSIYFTVDRGQLVIASFDSLNKRLVGKLPDWLGPWHGNGLLATLNDEDQVISLSVGSNITNAIVAKFKTLPKLARLDIQAVKQVTGKCIGDLADIPSLTYLQLYHIEVSNQDLKPLRKLKKLQTLSLIATGISDTGLDHLADLTQLRVLKLAGNRITNSGIAKLRNLVDLEVLDIAHTNWFKSRMSIDDDAMQHVARLSKLRKLNISGSQVSDTGFARLAGLRRLREVLLSRTQITGASFKHLVGFSNLESLTLSGPFFSDTGMQHLARCTNLKRMTISYTKIGDKGLRHIGKLPKLELLHLDSHFITNAGIAHLSSLKSLKVLSLRGSKVSDDSLKHISRIKSLTRLSLSGSGEPGVHIGDNFTQAGYTHLAKMANLNTLFLNNARASWMDLRGLRQLKVLNMMMVEILQDDVRRLQRALPNTQVSAAWGGSSIVPLQFSNRRGKR